MNTFEYLADVYDEFVGADYEKIAQYILSAVHKYCPEAEIGVDLGCGSGTLTRLLSRQKLDMIGIDASSAMLARAMEKIEGNLLFLQQQLTDIDLYGTADLFVSTLDCLNYLTDFSQVEQFFQRVSLFSNPGALFVFDFNTLYKYRQLNAKNFVYENDDVFLVWENEFDGKLIHYNLTFFEKSGEVYRRVSEQQQQRYYQPEQIYDCLSKNGFKILKINDDYSDQQPTEQTLRIVVTAQKEAR